MNSFPLIMMTLFAIGMGLLSTWFETRYYWQMRKYIEETKMAKTQKDVWKFMLKKNMSEVLLFIIGLGFGFMIAVMT